LQEAAVKNEFEMKTSVRPLAIITISLFGFFLIISYYADKSQLELTGREMLEKVRTTDYTIAKDSLENIFPVTLIDIRSQEQFLLSHMKDAINVPLPDVLNEDYQSLFQEDITKIIISDDLTKAHETWMLLTQLGYEHLLVLSD